MDDRDPLEWLELAAINAPGNSIVRGRDAEVLIAVMPELLAVVRLARRDRCECWEYGCDVCIAIDGLDARLRAEMGER